MKVINIQNPEEAKTVLKRIGVDPYGVGSMLGKALNVNVLLENKSCKIANIIKQEMLSLGGDAAVARGSVSCTIPASDILIMGTLKQISALAKKLNRQPFGLDLLARDLTELLKNIHRREFVLRTSRRTIKLGRKTGIMGILNVTPDSFSDGGYFISPEKAVEHGLRLAEEGADMIDVGGESTRPGSAAVPVKLELKRVIPVIESLAKKIKIPISIDTKKAGVARAAVEAGAEIINDVSGLNGDRDMAKTVAKTQAALVIMHMRGRPENMQSGDLRYGHLMGEIIDYLRKSTDQAVKSGVDREHIVIDPGIGFGKTFEDNYKIIRNLSELKVLGLPVMVGTSRKSFIGRITGDEPLQRMEGTAATVTAAILSGCNLIRVHDVASMKKVAAVADAVAHAGEVTK